MKKKEIEKRLNEFRDWLIDYPILPAPIDRQYVQRKFLELFFVDEKYSEVKK